MAAAARVAGTRASGAAAGSAAATAASPPASSTPPAGMRRTSSSTRTGAGGVEARIDTYERVKRPAAASPASGRSSSRRSSSSRSSSVTPTLTPPRAGRWSSADGAGFLLGLFGFSLLSAYVRYGMPGVRSWWAAKFLNAPDPAIVAAEAARGISPTPRPSRAPTQSSSGQSGLGGKGSTGQGGSGGGGGSW